MPKFTGAIAAALFVTPIAVLAQAQPVPGSDGASELRERAQAALPAVREALDGALTDYPSARFRNVKARLVRSVYASDEGQSNKVPWNHRGGVVLVFCGEMNAKNRMGGYTGWEAFGLQPSQTDIVTLYSMDFSNPRKPREPVPTNIAEKPKLMLPNNLYDEHLALMCGSEAEAIDPTDLTEGVTYRA